MIFSFANVTAGPQGGLQAIGQVVRQSEGVSGNRIGVGS